MPSATFMALQVILWLLTKREQPKHRNAVTNTSKYTFEIISLCLQFQYYYMCNPLTWYWRPILTMPVCMVVAVQTLLFPFCHDVWWDIWLVLDFNVLTHVIFITSVSRCLYYLPLHFALFLRTCEQNPYILEMLK